MFRAWSLVLVLARVMPHHKPVLGGELSFDVNARRRSQAAVLDRGSEQTQGLQPVHAPLLHGLQG